MKNPGAFAPGCLGRNVGRLSTRNSPVPVILIGRGRKECALSPVRVGPSPARIPPDRPPLTSWRFATSRGLPPALRRGGGCSGFADCKTQIAPDCQDGGRNRWICQDGLRLAILVVRANQNRFVGIVVWNP